MLEVIIALVGIVVTTMVMIAGILTFRSWGDEQGVNEIYPDRSDENASQSTMRTHQEELTT